MGSGFTGEIIHAHAEGGKEGEYLSVRVDFVLLPDYALALSLEDLRELRKNVWDREKVLVAVDHFAPPSTVERANLVKKVLSFVKEEGISHCSLYGGICHQLLVEGPWVGPGMVILGADSHTTTAGALGCLATGLGSTDILYTLITGTTWLRPPEACRVNLKGKLPAYLMGKDIALALLGRVGESGFLSQAVEFYDLEGMILMDDRLALCNMVVEGGAKNGLFFPDDVTRRYIEGRNGHSGQWKWTVDGDPQYRGMMDIDLSSLNPQVALPHSPSLVVDVEEAKGELIQQVFIGSCTGGRFRDLEVSAGILKGKKVAPGLRLLVVPASLKIFLAAMESGYIKTILEAGGVVLNPSCGPCGGIDKGVLGAEERCLSTSNRNYRGRMGDPSSMVYLASPLTAAATALRGEITDPREVL
jgi:3-isopropylmalate/(R)-2-methylmalate dehydratase large subunit